MSEHNDKKPKQITTVVLARHASNDWLKSGKLAGRTPGIHLNDEGRQEADRLAQRLAVWPIQAIYSSPLERAQETAEPIASIHKLSIETAHGIGEVDYGDWTGQEIKPLSDTPLWRLVQTRPSAARFPNGESLRELQTRCIDQVEQLVEKHAHETIVLVSHGDVIRMIAAHYLGLHPDLYQRLVINPASLSTLVFTLFSAFVISLNDTAHINAGPPSHG
ncbi:MAG: MSMEG_4193 family putative phosphomutase [Anaerolineales bacterium]|nr:MSMEG_4193 family putative phosphomutase [Anaerolineales bacterium]